jgi:hypothetical protein
MTFGYFPTVSLAVTGRPGEPTAVGAGVIQTPPYYI